MRALASSWPSASMLAIETRANQHVVRTKRERSRKPDVD
jgi:hypothetical protein